jgi:arylsulfate sulfotransferase
MLSPFKCNWCAQVKTVSGLAAWLVFSGLSPLCATITNVHLSVSPSSPQVLGTVISMVAAAKDTDPGPVSYKWEVLQPGSSGFSVLRDFDLEPKLTWTPSFTEGTYQLRLTARDYRAGTSAQTMIHFQVTPLVTGNQAVVVPTANPLVALLSAPTCPSGSTMRVFFQQSGVANAAKSFTDWRACHSGSMNFYIGGMAANQSYQMNYQVQSGSKTFTSSALSFTTGALPGNLPLPSLSVLVPVPDGNPNNVDINSRLMVMDFAQAPYIPLAMDLSNPPNIVWYYNVVPTQLTRPVPGGTWLAIVDGLGTGTGYWVPTVVTRQQVLREIDLTGNVIRETNIDRLQEQLDAMGMTDVVGRFNHDAIRISNGDTIALADVQRIFPAGTQGWGQPINVIGALVMLLDPNFQLISYWNAFDHDCNDSTCLSINRAAVLNEICAYNSQGKTAGGCPPQLISSPALDWLHSNSIQLLSDGGLVMSVRDQDWVIKIDYQNGSTSASGNILWRLGNGGDFKLTNPPMNDPFPWFSGQHDGGFVGNTQSTFTVLDNGNTRLALNPGGSSRGQVYTIDENNMTATINLDAPLGTFSPALGTAQALLNGDYFFISGRPTINSKLASQALEFGAGTSNNYLLQANTITYRAWRLTDFYNVPNNGANGPAGVKK